ncbi:MAG TPA: RICIN domain-containing protein [Blastocatellia bacterium]|nr:RICIN domain-containing protein [Blastocatellia bacterium]
MLSKTPATIQRARVSGLLLIALGALFARAANAAPFDVVNGTQFTTTTGAPIQAHGGGVIKVGPYYYWFGENRNPNSTFFAVSCYRSTDLKNWEFRNNVLTANSSAELNPANIERPKVVFNSNTGRYVMWMHWENGVHYGEARAAVASSATVDGNYTYHGSFRPYQNAGVVDHGKPGYMSRDCTLFVDTNGIGYFISAANENADLHVYRLTGDYLGIDILVVKLWVGQKREAPAMFKRNGFYFLVTSGATGWSPNQQKYAFSTNIASGWSNPTNFADGVCYSSQTTFVLPIQGSSTTSYLFLGDRWAGAWGGRVNDSTYVWLPLTFPTNTSLSMSWRTVTTIDTATGALGGSNFMFKLRNVNSGLVADVPGFSTADGTRVMQFADNGGANQKWRLLYDGAGFFKIVNAHSNKPMDVVSGSTADGAQIIQFTDNGGANQRWLPVDIGGGRYEIRSKASGKLLDIQGATPNSGANLIQMTANGGNSQKWTLAPTN